MWFGVIMASSQVQSNNGADIRKEMAGVNREEEDRCESPMWKRVSSVSILCVLGECVLGGRCLV